MKKAVWSGVVLMTCLAFTGTAMASDAQKPRQRAAQRQIAKRFKAMDANHDGTISRDEWKGRPKAFDRLDANHDNALTPQELQRGARKAGKIRRR
jgi:Ca2+-binding EF-hand superfamily protein